MHLYFIIKDWKGNNQKRRAERKEKDWRDDEEEINKKGEEMRGEVKKLQNEISEKGRRVGW